MTTVKAARATTNEVLEMVRNAGAALAALGPALPESERGRALAVVTLAQGITLSTQPRAVPESVGGNYAHQQGLFAEARAAGCWEEMLTAWSVGQSPTEMLRIGLEKNLPSTRTWAASFVALRTHSALLSIVSASFCLRLSSQPPLWDRDAQITWGSMVADARSSAASALTLASMLEA